MTAPEEANAQEIEEEQEAVTYGPFLDKLLVNAKGRIKPKFIDLLKKRREALRDAYASGEYIKVSGLPGGDPYLYAYHPKSSFVSPGTYGYYLQNDLFNAAVTTKSGPPTMRIRFQNRILYERSLEDLDRLAQEIGDRLFIGTPDIQVAEVDLAVDGQDPEFGIPRKEGVQCQRRRGIVETDLGHGNEHSITIGARSRTYSVKIYDKGAEIKSSGKDYITEAYRATGRFREDEPVYRVELRFKRSHLKALKTDVAGEGIETISDLRNSLGDLIRSVVGDPENDQKPAVKIVDPESSTRANRRRETASWERIAERFRQGQTVTGRTAMRIESSPSYKRTIQVLASEAARFAAWKRYAGEPEPHLDQYPEVVRNELTEYLSNGGKSWDSFVLEKYNELIRRSEVDGLPPRTATDDGF